MTGIAPSLRTRVTHPLPASNRPVLGVVAAIAASVAVNAGVAALATPLVAPRTPMVGLVITQYAPLTAIGVLLGTLGWWIIRRNARRPRASLRAIVPAVVVASFVPDLLILATGASLLNALALVLMHIAVAVITVPILSRVLPLPAEAN